MAHVLEKKWRSEDIRVRENADFSAVLLSDRMLEGLKRAGFKKPSPIQLEAVPLGRLGRDLIVQAKSGTGKTLVFVIIALEVLKRKIFRPQVLVIAPTREIATQICSVVKTVGSTFPKLTCNSFIGGLPLFEDKEKAVMSQIIIGTPGRLKQLIQMKALPTNSIKLLIFDEADELLYSNSFRDDIEEIFTSLPDDKQVIVTSATISPATKKQMFRYLRDPCIVRLNAKQLALLGMIHYATIVKFCPMPILQYKLKLDAVEKILKTVQFSQCLLFCNGIQRVEVLYRDIKKWGFSTAYITSAKEQGDRLKAIERLKRFKCKVLVSSDLTSRGIDAENVDLVINFDLSYTTEVYMHRVGRAGRYGSVGVAISIMHENEIQPLQKIEKEGSFKTYKLPDPIPKDLILYPVQEDFVVDDTNSENTDCSEVKKSAKSHNVKHDVLNKKGYASKKQVSIKNVQVKEVSETTIDTDIFPKSALLEPSSQTTSDIKSHNGITTCTVQGEIEVEKVANNVIFHSDIVDNALSETSTQSTSGYKKSHVDITKPTAECEVKIEEVDEDDISHLVHFDEKVADKILQNGYSNSNNKKLCKNKDSELMSDYHQSKLIDSESTEKLYHHDIHESSSVSCDGSVFENQDIINDNNKKDFHLNSQLYNVNDTEKKNDFDIDGKRLNEMHIDCTYESSEIKDIVENIDDSVNCDQEFVKSSDTLNKVKVFVDTYEPSKKVESTKMKDTFDKDCQLNENFSKELITIDMINDLKYQKNEFFYKTLKTFLENKDECSPSHKSKKDDKIEKSNENINILSQNTSNTELVSAEMNKLTESSEIENKEVFAEKPNFESTPHLNDKIKQENSKMSADDVVCKQIIPDRLQQLLDGFSDESDWDYLDTNEEAKMNSSVGSSSDSLSSESESDSLSSDSETDSSFDYSNSETNSDLSSSTTSSANEDIYHHNYFRTGRQNPSLISDSSRKRIHQDHIHAYYFQNSKCPCCCAANHYMPQQSIIRSSETSRGINRGRRHRIVDQNASVPFSEGESASRFRRAYQPVNPRGYLSCTRRDHQTASRREQNFADRNVTQSHFPMSHPRCHRLVNSSRNIAREDDQNRNENPTRRRSSRCYHTLRCFLPTEHRCHPNIPVYPCSQSSTCGIWYKTFYDQWLHIQNVIH